MEYMSFTRYLLKRKPKAHENLIRDFLDDFRHDWKIDEDTPGWPTADDGNCWQTYDEHLQGACSGAKRAFETLYAEYLGKLGVKLHKAVRHFQFATIHTGLIAFNSRYGDTIFPNPPSLTCPQCGKPIVYVGDAALTWYIDPEGWGAPSLFRIKHSQCAFGNQYTNNYKDTGEPGTYYDPIGILALCNRTSFPLMHRNDVEEYIVSGCGSRPHEDDQDDLDKALDVIFDVQWALNYAETGQLLAWSRNNDRYREFASAHSAPSQRSLPRPLTSRFFVLRRDGYRCQICGRTAQDGATLEVDHRVPRSKGGSNDMDNLWTLCFECNRGKHAHDL